MINDPPVKTLQRSYKCAVFFFMLWFKCRYYALHICHCLHVLKFAGLGWRLRVPSAPVTLALCYEQLLYILISLWWFTFRSQVRLDSGTDYSTCRSASAAHTFTLIISWRYGEDCIGQNWSGFHLHFGTRFNFVTLQSWSTCSCLFKSFSSVHLCLVLLLHFRGHSHFMHDLYPKV